MVRSRDPRLPIIAYGKWEGVGSQPVLARSHQAQGRAVAQQHKLRVFHGQISAVQFDWNVQVPLPAEWENVGKVRQGAYAESVDEILSPTIKEVPDFDQVFSVPRNLVDQQGVRVEAEAAGVRQLLAFSIVERQACFQPTRDGVRDIGQQLSCLDVADQRLSCFRSEAKEVCI